MGKPKRDPANVSTLRLVEIGDERMVGAKAVLKEAKRAELDHVLIIGRDKNGELWASGSLNGAHSLWLIEKLRERILDGCAWSLV